MNIFCILISHEVRNIEQLDPIGNGISTVQAKVNSTNFGPLYCLDWFLLSHIRTKRQESAFLQMKLLKGSRLRTSHYLQ